MSITQGMVTNEQIPVSFFHFPGRPRPFKRPFLGDNKTFELNKGTEEKLFFPNMGNWSSIKIRTLRVWKLSMIPNCTYLMKHENLSKCKSLNNAEHSLKFLAQYIQ